MKSKLVDFYRKSVSVHISQSCLWMGKVAATYRITIKAQSAKPTDWKFGISQRLVSVGRVEFKVCLKLDQMMAEAERCGVQRLQAKYQKNFPRKHAENSSEEKITKWWVAWGRFVSCSVVLLLLEITMEKASAALDIHSCSLFIHPLHAGMRLMLSTLPSNGPLVKRYNWYALVTRADHYSDGIITNDFSLLLLLVWSVLSPVHRHLNRHTRMPPRLIDYNSIARSHRQLF